MSQRFVLEDSEYPGAGDDPRRALRDTKTGRVLGTDGGEAEDNTFRRDWAWVPAALNALDQERAAPEDLTARLALSEALADAALGLDSCTAPAEAMNRWTQALDLYRQARRPDEGAQLKMQQLQRAETVAFFADLYFPAEGEWQELDAAREPSIWRDLMDALSDYRALRKP